jgi:hypothetical protein
MVGGVEMGALEKLLYSDRTVIVLYQSGSVIKKTLTPAVGILAG